MTRPRNKTPAQRSGADVSPLSGRGAGFAKLGAARSAIRGLLAVALSVTPAIAETGVASTYTDTKLPSGEAWRDGLTAAHKTLPIGTWVKVTNRRNGRAVVVQINDRGPYKRGRIIDMTPMGARMIGLDGLGRVTVVKEPEGPCSELAGFSGAWLCRFVLAHRTLR